MNQICVLSVEKQEEKCFDTRSISNQYVWDHNNQYIAYLSKTLAGEVDLFMIDINEGIIENLTEDGNKMIEQNINNILWH